MNQVLWKSVATALVILGGGIAVGQLYKGLRVAYTAKRLLDWGYAFADTHYGWMTIPVIGLMGFPAAFIIYFRYPSLMRSLGLHPTWWAHLIESVLVAPGILVVGVEAFMDLKAKNFSAARKEAGVVLLVLVSYVPLLVFFSPAVLLLCIFLYGGFSSLILLGYIVFFFPAHLLTVTERVLKNQVSSTMISVILLVLAGLIQIWILSGGT